LSRWRGERDEIFNELKPETGDAARERGGEGREGGTENDRNGSESLFYEP